MYNKSVERACPGCILFLIDQSFSMTDNFAGTDKRRCDKVEVAINRFLSELIAMCEKGDDEPRHYFDIGVIGYTTDRASPNPNPVVKPLLEGSLRDRDLVSVVDLYREPSSVEDKQKDDGAGGLVTIKIPTWYKVPPADQMAGTPMKSAMEYVQRVASAWTMSHRECFPPIIIHLTDGEATDATPEAVEEAANGIKWLDTDDGKVLLFNCHLSSSDAEGLIFPSSESQLPDKFSRMLFRMSSEVPDRIRELAEGKGISIPSGARGMAFNADSMRMLQLISVGTSVASPSNLR